MKDRKLVVRPSCCKRNFYLHRREGILCVKFMPPKWSYWRRVLGKTNPVWKSTGTSEPAAAVPIAKRIIESYWKEGESGAPARDALTSHSEFAKIGDVLARYEERSAEERGRGVEKAVQADTARNNCNALRCVVQHRYPGDADERPTTLLTGDLLEHFSETAKLASSSRASYIIQARSVFSRRAMKFYKGMSLPDLTSFREFAVDRPKQIDLEPPDLNMLRAMDAAAVRLAESDPGAYVAHLLFSRNGRRNIEILNARTWWISDSRIGIIERPTEGFRPKGRSGWCELAQDVIAEILRFQHLCVEGYLVPGANKTERHDAIYKRHSKWVQKFIRGKSKTSYELRRYYGSRLLDLGWSLYDVSRELLHSSFKVTERWYAYRMPKQNRPLVGMANLVPNELIA